MSTLEMPVKITEVAMTFGDWLKNAREAKGETQRSLSKKATKSDGYISLLENGERQPSREVIEILARVLNADENEGLLLAGFLPRNSEIEYVSDPEEKRILSSYRGVSSENKPLAQRMVEAMRRAEHEDSLGGKDIINDDSYRSASED